MPSPVFDPNAVLASLPIAAPQPQQQTQRDLQQLLLGPELIELQALASGISPLPGFHSSCATSSEHRRLGLYAEDLLAAALAEPECPYRLLGRNLQVASGPGGRTLGEFDFIIEQRASGRPAHLELACKYYLGLPEASGPSAARQWLGPNCNDRLDIKIDKLIGPQLGLSRRPEARALLQGLGLDPARPLARHYLLRGRLYYPAFAELAPPVAAAADHLRGLWCSRAQLGEFLGGLTRHWPRWGFSLLSPLQLLAPLPALPMASEAELARALTQHFAAAPLRPAALALHNPRGQELRLYVVDDSWPQRAARAVQQPVN